MGFFDKLLGKEKESVTLKEADKLNDEFIANNPIAKDTEDEMMRQASKFMTSGNFEESINLYKRMAEEYPDNRGLYESQVGAGYYFLGNYEEAINYYVSALKNGGDEDMADDNIWEATEVLYKQTGDKSHLEKYLELFPKGNYQKDASKLLD